jgi:AAA15 family ATPase/GTPase
MLIQFSIENHRSIKDSAVISFAASKDKSLESYLLHPDEKRALLPAIAIYGANAAGKSNVLHALMTMKDMVVGEAAKISKGQKLPWEPFGDTTVPTSFEVVFIYQGVRYAYGFSFDAKKIYTEYLYHWPNGREALIFSRENGAYEFRENVNEQITLSNRTPDNKLYLVSSNDWNLPQTENAYKWFLEKLTFLMEEAPATSETVAQIVSGDEKKARILKELLLADLGISDVTVKNISGKAPVITTTHRVIGADGSVEHFQLLMDQESSGTQRFFSRIGGWLQTLENGALLVVDEIEDSLHPLLTKRLIEMVQDNTINTEGAQLLFTTHDAMLLDLTFFRRDQIWFAEKDEKSCATELYSLASFSPRKGENIRKGYLQGRFGAIPFIGGDGLWQE